MADHCVELPDTGQLYNGFRKSSEILRMQNQLKVAKLSNSKPVSSFFGSVSVSQPDNQTSTTTGSEWFKANDDNNIYFRYQSQSSLPDFTQSSNVIVANNKCGFIKASALHTVISKKHDDVNTKKSRTKNLHNFGKCTQLTTDCNSDFYQDLETTGHQVLTNPFLFTSMKNPVRPLPLPKRTKKSSIPFQNKGNCSVASVPYKKNKTLSLAAFPPHSKKKKDQIKNQSSITNFIKTSAREKNSKLSANKEELCKKRVSSRLECRSNRHVCKKMKIGCAFSSISNNSRAVLESITENTSDGEEVQITNFTKEDLSSSSDEENPEDYNLSKVYFGLFGSNLPEMSKGEDYFQKLPDELKRIIFCQLPSNHLFEICPKVCCDWQRIIYDKKFVPWKFRHYCYKKKNKLNSYWIPTFGNVTTFHSSIASLISDMKSQSTTFTDLLPSLKQHMYYKEAKLVLKTCFPHGFANNVPIPWALIAVLCIISDTVKSLEQLLQILASASSKSSLDVLLDKVYEILFLLILKEYQDLSPILHGIIYRLSCALHSFENSGTVTVADLNNSIQPHQQSIVRYCESSKKIRFSPEQLQIINHNVQPGDIIKIIAFAGTGKTSTLVRYTKMRPGLKFLLVVYNKSVAEHAKTVFPQNVHCTTGHGLAFKTTGFIYAKNNKLQLRNLKVCDLENALHCDKEYNSVLHCQVVLTVLENFFSSKDPELQQHHVTAAMRLWEAKMFQIFSSGFDNEHWLNDAKNIWHQMIDLNNKNIKMTHDGYLKLYQIKKPQLTKYDVILIDEAQDLTPAVADILISQKLAKILVGDPYQQIYAFRGAVNLMSDIEATHTFFLTQSFRFGHEIASVANFILNYYCRTNTILVGSSKESTIEGKDIGQVAYISRSNSVLFKMAAFVCCVQKPRVKVFFIGGLESWEFDLLRRLCIFRDEGYFQHSSSSRDIFLSKFPSYWALSRYVKESMDNELLPKVQILEQYTSNLHKVLSYIEASEVKDMKDADVIFTTAHKAKGLEFSTVKILDDFNIDTYEERNLLYVAITRAKYSLYLDQKTISLWEKSGELRLKVRCYDSLNEETVRCCCNHFQEEVHDEILPPIVMEKKRLRLVGDTETGGFICKKCLIKEHHSLSIFYEKPDSILL